MSGYGPEQQIGKFRETALKCTEGTLRNPVGKSVCFGLLVCWVFFICLGFFLFGQVFYLVGNFCPVLFFSGGFIYVLL